MMRNFPATITVLAGIAASAPVHAQTQLAGSEWGFADDDARFVQFLDRGRVAGFGGCNQFFGRYATKDTTLSVVSAAAGRKFCGARKMKAERQLLIWLGHARTFEMTHLTLRLLDEDGNELVTLQRRDFD